MPYCANRPAVRRLSRHRVISFASEMTICIPSASKRSRASASLSSSVSMVGTIRPMSCCLASSKMLSMYSAASMRGTLKARSATWQAEDMWGLRSVAKTPMPSEKRAASVWKSCTNSTRRPADRISMLFFFISFITREIRHSGFSFG